MEAALDRAICLFDKAKEDNLYYYFELSWNLGEWLCWLVDRSQRADHLSDRDTDGFLALARGQSSNLIEAVEPVLKKLEQMGYD